eukprot:1189756-Prorocentrum_minimum.AAC.4
MLLARFDRLMNGKNNSPALGIEVSQTVGEIFESQVGTPSRGKCPEPRVHRPRDHGRMGGFPKIPKLILTDAR